MRRSRISEIGPVVSVTLPTDSAGYLGRECPSESCGHYFKVMPGTGLAEAPQATCPYCGNVAAASDFSTAEQREYAVSVVRRQVVQAFQADLKAMEFESRPRRSSFGIGISLKLSPSPLPELHTYSEADLETPLVCDRCTLQYAIFGVFGYCPDCGTHNSLGILDANLQVIGKLLALAEEHPDAAVREKLVGSALVECVSAFEGWGSATALAFSKLATNPGKAAKLAFQNIRKAREKVQALFSYDLAGPLSDEELQALNLVFQKRHVLSHNMGVVDQPYVDSTGDTSIPVGQKLKFSAAEVSLAVALLPKVARGFLEYLEARHEPT